MSEAVITIATDHDTAALYDAASDEARRKIQVLVRMLLQTTPPSEQSLQQLMDDMSAEAQASGLTPDILDQLLSSDD